MSSRNYIDPGSYGREVVNPVAAVSDKIGFTPVIIAGGSATKWIRNEKFIKGMIEGEALTIVAPVPPATYATAVLAKSSDQKQQNAVLYCDGIALPDVAWNFTGATGIQIYSPYYSSTGVYTIDYVTIDPTVKDYIEEVPVDMGAVGLGFDAANYVKDVDYQITTVGSDRVMDWTILTQATVSGVAGPYLIQTAKKTFGISLNGKAEVLVTITNQVPPLTTTAATIVGDINTALNAAYGASYNAVATDSPAGTVKLTAPVLEPYTGANSSIVLYSKNNNTTTDDCLKAIFNVTVAVGSNVEYRGVGRKPAYGQAYYASYTYARPTADYNDVKYFYTDKDFYDDIGLPATDNPLALMGYLAWTESIEKLAVVQVKKNGVSYSDSDYMAAIDAVVDERSATDICCDRNTVAVRSRIYTTVEQECAQSKSNPKRAFLGVDRNASTGDMKTAGSLLYIAAKELRPGASSVARGRFHLFAHPNWTFDYIDENNANQTAEVSSAYFGVCAAARACSFEKASQSLFKQKFSQISVQTNYSDSERRELSANGITVCLQEGSAVIYDALTTDASGDARFDEPSASFQKDKVLFELIEAYNDNVIGIVPDDPADFVAALKVVGGGVITANIDSGDIGYYTNADGTVRDINYTSDIVAWKDATNPRKYYVRCYFNLKYPCKYVFFDYAVDVPFTVGS